MIDEEPTRIFAGDTVEWVRTFSDYPAPDWVVEYNLVSENAYIQIPTVASGQDHAVSVAAATTREWEPGYYTWTARAKQGVEVFTADSGVMVIAVDISQQQSGADLRSPAKRIVDDLTQAYADLASGKAMVANYSIGDSSFTFRSAEDILPQLKYWKAELALEEQQQRVERGESGRRKIKIYL